MLLRRSNTYTETARALKNARAARPYPCPIASPAGTAGSAFLPLQIVDEAANHTQPLIPEGGIGRVQSERRQKLAVPQGPAGGQHLQVTLGESVGRILIDRVQRIDQTVAESICVDVEGRMDEVGDISPVVPVSLIEAKRRTKALGLDRQPDFANPLGRQLF